MAFRSHLALQDELQRVHCRWADIFGRAHCRDALASVTCATSFDASGHVACACPASVSRRQRRIWRHTGITPAPYLHRTFPFLLVAKPFPLGFRSSWPISVTEWWVGGNALELCVLKKAHCTLLHSLLPKSKPPLKENLKFFLPSALQIGQALSSLSQIVLT